MNANDHEEHGDSAVALRRAQLEKIEVAIEHTEESLQSLRDVRDALVAELEVNIVDHVHLGRWYWDSRSPTRFFRPELLKNNVLYGVMLSKLEYCAKRWRVELPCNYLHPASAEDSAEAETYLKEHPPL